MQTKHPNSLIHLTTKISRWLSFGGALAVILAWAPWVARGAPCNYTIPVPAGLSMIANQCDSLLPGGNTLNNVLPGVPTGSQIFKWDNTTQTWLPTATYSGGSWLPSYTLNPGEGAWFNNPGPSFALTFSGNAHTPVPLNLPAGCCIVSCQTPQTCTIDDIVGQPPLPGDTVYRLMNGMYMIFRFDEFDLMWLKDGQPSVPRASVGEAVWICRASGGAVPSPCQPDITPPLIDCACLTDLAHNLLLTNACQGFIPNLCQFTNCFSDDCCLLSCSQSPLAGTPVGPGTHPITITLTDCATNRTTSTNCMLDFVVREPMSGCFRTNAVVPCGAAVVTCFSGQCYPGPGTPNPNGPVLAVIDVNNPPPPGPVNWPAPMYHGELWPSTTPTWTRANLGEIFGVTLDSQNPPNIFVTAAGFYCGVSTGGPDGPGEAGVVHRIDGTTALISCLAKLPNPSGVGLGNICHDPVSGNFFVSNFEDGNIYRVSPTSTCGGPTPPVCWDHGVTGRPYEGLAPIPDPISAPGVSAPGTTPLGRRVWGLRTQGQKLYYSVWNENSGTLGTHYDIYTPTDSNEVWSVIIDNLGNCTGPAKREFKLPPLGGAVYGSPNGRWSSPVSDIKFSPDGSKMLLAERSVNGMFPNSLVPPGNAHISRVLEYCLSGNTWGYNKQYFIGPCNAPNNSEGGADYACDKLIWATGDLLATPLIYGLAGIPTAGNSCGLNYFNTTVMIDLDGFTAPGQYDKTEIGDVVIRRCCDCCIKITNKLVQCVSTNMTYQWDFCVTNCWTYPIKYLSILDLPPGVTPSEDIITLVPPLNPGQGKCFTLYLTNKSGLEFTNLCFTVGAHTTNFNVCCSVTNCIALPPCCVLLPNDVATAIGGPGNCYTYSLGNVKNLSSTPIKYLLLLPQPDAPANCFTFTPNVITFTPPLAPNATPVAGQMFPTSVKVKVNAVCAKPWCFLAAAHDSNLSHCCSVPKYITPGPIVGCTPVWAAPVVLEGTDVPIPFGVSAASVGGAARVNLMEGTNVLRTIANPADGQYEVVLSNVVAGTYVLRWDLVDSLGGVWSSDDFTLYVLSSQLPIIPPPAPVIAAAALADGHVRFILATEPGVTCHVEYTESLAPADWKVLRTIVGDGSAVTVTDALTNAPQRFYRMRVP